MLLLAIFITLCLIKESTHAGGNCTWSLRTVQEVSTCPVTTANKEKAEKIKKCHELAEKQNCTEASMFKYHCVINEDNDKFLEVCAPAIEIILGHCATFNLTGGRIEPHKNKTCNRGSFPCPQSYLSSDSYKFPSCYGFPDNVSRYETTTNIDSCSCPTSKETNLSDEFIILISGSVSIVLVSFLFVFCCIVIRNAKFAAYSERSERDERGGIRCSDSSNERALLRMRELKTKEKVAQKKGKTENKQLFCKQNSAISLTDTYSINHISRISCEMVWLSNRKKVMKIDLKGRILNAYDIDDTRASASHTIDINGDLFYIKDNDIHHVSSDGRTKTFLTPEWNVLSIYSSHINDNLILGTYIIEKNEFKAKLLKYSKTRELLQTIQYHKEEEYPLYSFPLFISENINRDICTTDMEKCLVTVVNESGEFRFSYNGQSTEKGFFPTGICNDAVGQIIVCNRHYANPSVHLLNINGIISAIILTKNENGINDPYGICADDDGNLYLGQHGSNIVMVFRYLQ